MIENVSTQLTVFHCFAHCLLPGRAFASLYALLFLEKEAEIGGRVSVAHQEGVQVHVVKFIGGNISMLQNSYFHGIFKKANPPPPPTHTHTFIHMNPPFQKSWIRPWIWAQTVCKGYQQMTKNHLQKL